MKIIALSGKAQAGKSYVARLIASHVPGSVVRGFASELRAELTRAGIPETFLQEKTPAARSLMQAWGAARRATDPAHWVRALRAEAENLEDRGCPLLLIDDLRFENEAEWLQKEGALLIRLRRIRSREETPPLTMDQQLDESETALDFYTGWNMDIAIASGDEVKLAGVSAHALAWFTAQTEPESEAKP